MLTDQHLAEQQQQKKSRKRLESSHSCGQIVEKTKKVGRMHLPRGPIWLVGYGLLKQPQAGFLSLVTDRLFESSFQPVI